MATVESILNDVFGPDKADEKAAKALGVVRSAVGNWKTRGHFPARLLAPLLRFAQERGVQLEMDDVPTTPQTRQENGSVAA